MKAIENEVSITNNLQNCTYARTHVYRVFRLKWWSQIFQKI